MSDPRGKCPDWFYETMDAAKLQRLQSEHMAIWNQFKLHAEARGAWHMALRMMVTEHRSFAEAAVFIGYRLPDPESNVDLDQLRTRLGKMTDVELRQFGRSAAYMCSPEANLGAEPRPVFVLQLDEARAEWRRRHPNRMATSGARHG